MEEPQVLPAIDQAKGLQQMKEFTEAFDMLIRKYCFSDMHRMIWEADTNNDWLIRMDQLNDKIKAIELCHK